MTTPAPREFVLEPRARDDALAALAQAFTLTGQPGAPGGGTRRRTWFDTFDWRLNRAGLMLEYAPARRGERLGRIPGGHLLLTREDGTQLAEQPVAGWPPGRPVLAEQLPPGPVRDALLPVTSPRALLPVVKAASAMSVTRLLNADGKTVARLITDKSTVATPEKGSHQAELPPRLSIAEVRGYPGQASKAARLLAEVPDASPATEPLLSAARRELGLARPAGGVDAGVVAAMPAPVATARLLLKMLDTLELNVEGALRDLDTEFLHDLRVAVRRTRSAIKLLGRVLPADLAAQYGAEFKWLGDMTTPVRDLDVHLLGFDAMAGGLKAAAPADLEPFRAFLARRRTREFRRLAAVLRSPRFRSITHDWRKALLEILDARPPHKPANPKAAELAGSTTRRVLAKITTQGGAITPSSPAESLHDLRKRCKELRYLLEFFAPLHDPAFYKKVVGDLKQLQDCLGEFQDSQVQREEIHALADAMLAERAAPAATLLAMGEVAAGLAVSQAEARADFARRFARFAGPAGQQRFRALLNEPALR